MVLKPDDVERQEFATAWRGYDRQEVDRFLDLVAAALAQLSRERDQLAQRAEEVERDASDSLGAERLLKRALVEAQRTADETIAEARRTAEEILADAHRDAEFEREVARDQVAAIQQAVEEFHRLRAEHGERIRDMVQQIGELPPVPHALDQLVERSRSAAPPEVETAAPPPAPERADNGVLPVVDDDEDPPEDPPAPPWM